MVLEALNNAVKGLSLTIDEAVERIRNFGRIISADGGTYTNGRVLYLANNAKKYRTRKKNQNRLYKMRKAGRK